MPKAKNVQNLTIFVLMLNLVWRRKGRATNKGVLQQGAEENIWN
jgi:hypothetical protein